MDHLQPESVKVYFIDPINIISVIIDTLIKLNFEVYTVKESDKDKLKKIIKKNERSVIYFCVHNENAVKMWIEYIDSIQKMEKTQVLIGVFIFNNMRLEYRHLFFERGIATIQFSSIKEDTLLTMKKILLYFEARGKRKYVRAKTNKDCHVYFPVKSTGKTICSEIVEISAYAFSCIMNIEQKAHFLVGHFYNDVILILRGMRIRIAAKMMGFDKNNTAICLFTIYVPHIKDGQLLYHNKIPAGIKNRIYTYIKLFLKEDIKRQLAETGV